MATYGHQRQPVLHEGGDQEGHRRADRTRHGTSRAIADTLPTTDITAIARYVAGGRP